MANLAIHLLVLLQSVALFHQGQGQTYSNTMAIFQDKMGGDSYNIDVRPIKNQSRVIRVGVSFQILSIVELNDVSQSFNCNGFLFFIWRDEILNWDLQSYGGQTMIHPQAKDIWRPRVILANTLEDRDIFEDDNAPVTVDYNGTITWFPGSTFPTSCALDLTMYPFDEQTCTIQMMTMGYSTNEVQFYRLTRDVGTRYFTRKGDWDLRNSSIDLFNTSDEDTPVYSGFTVTFNLKRNPDGILINILLPVVFLSFLNLWVFLIPVESGEKITYGISVLMALSVSMSLVSEMIPKTSEKIPKIVIYILMLLIICLLTVITSIIIVFLHHKEVKETQHARVKAKIKDTINNITRAKEVIGAMKPGKTHGRRCNNKVQHFSISSTLPSSTPSSESITNDNQDSDREHSNPSRYRIIGKYIDLVALLFFTSVWCSVTLSFLLEISNK